MKRIRRRRKRRMKSRIRIWLLFLAWLILFLSSRRRQHVLPKHRLIFDGIHGVIFHKIDIFNNHCYEDLIPYRIRIKGILARTSTREKDNNSIQFNSILVYLRANLTAQRPITKLARVCTKKQKTYKTK
jgi:hypothetical protein